MTENLLTMPPLFVARIVHRIIRTWNAISDRINGSLHVIADLNASILSHVDVGAAYRMK
jgi:hypothetical protein